MADTEGDIDFVAGMANDVIREHYANGHCNPTEPCPIVQHHQRELTKISNGSSVTMGLKVEPKPKPKKKGAPLHGADAYNGPQVPKERPARRTPVPAPRPAVPVSRAQHVAAFATGFLQGFVGGAVKKNGRSR